MEYYEYRCPSCHRSFSFVGYKTGIGKTKAQLKKMADDSNICRHCGYDGRTGKKGKLIDLWWERNKPKDSPKKKGKVERRKKKVAKRKKVVRSSKKKPIRKKVLRKVWRWFCPDCEKQCAFHEEGNGGYWKCPYCGYYRDKN